MIPTTVTSVLGASQLAGTTVPPPASGEEAVVQPQGTSAVYGQTDATEPDQERKSDLSQLTEAVQRLQTTSDLASRKLRFRISETGDTLQVLVLDGETEEVIRAIPPDEVLKLAERIRETLSLVIDTVA